LTKVDPSLTIDEYQSLEYLTLTTFLNMYGLDDTAIEQLSPALKLKYQEWVNNANRTVESALYKYNDQIPLDKLSESFTFAKSMALHWAQYEKAAEEDTPNKAAKLKLWEMDKQHLLETMQSQPQRTTQRVVTASDFPDDAPLPFSQSYGLADFL